MMSSTPDMSPIRAADRAGLDRFDLPRGEELGWWAELAAHPDDQGGRAAHRATAGP